MYLQIYLGVDGWRHGVVVIIIIIIIIKGIYTAQVRKGHKCASG